MSSNSPPNTRLSFTECMNTNNLFKAIVERNKEAIQRLCANNEILLKFNGKSAYRQLKEVFVTYSFCFSLESYSCFKLGKKATCNSVYEWILSSYWGLTPDELRALDVTQDLSYIKPCVPPIPKVKRKSPRKK